MDILTVAISFPKFEADYTPKRSILSSRTAKLFTDHRLADTTLEKEKPGNDSTKIYHWIQCYRTPELVFATFVPSPGLLGNSLLLLRTLCPTYGQHGSHKAGGPAFLVGGP